MARALKFVFVVALLSVAGAWLADHPGRIALTWEGWRVDTSVAFLAAVVLLISVVAALVYRFWLGLRRVPSTVRKGLHERRRRRGYRALTRGMVAVAAGDAQEAGKQVKRADVLLGDPALTLLLSAQTAQLNGDENAAARFFEAMRDKPETEFLGLRGLLNQALKRGDWAEALRLARRAHRLNPKSQWVGDNLLALEVREGQWRDAVLTLKSVVKNKAIDPLRGRRLDGVLALQLSADAEDRGDGADALKQARKAVDLAPALVPAAARLARLQAASGRKKQGRATLDAAWGRVPHPDLLTALRDIEGDTKPLDWVKAVQQLVRKQPDHPESRIALAGAALAAELWGEARKQLDPLRGHEAPARVCRLMARLEDGEHGDRTAANDWLTRASQASPDPVWVCTDCFAAARAWTARCRRCAGFDTLRWEVPGGETLIAAPEQPAAALAPHPQPPQAIA